MNFDVGQGLESKEFKLPALEQLITMGRQYISQIELNKIRKDHCEVLLYDRLENVIKRLNLDFGDDGIHNIIQQIKEDRFTHS